MSEQQPRWSGRERRRHYRQDVLLRIALGPMPDDERTRREIVLIQRQAALMESARRIRVEAEPVLEGFIDDGLAFLEALGDVLGSCLEGISFHDVMVNLSEGGVGFLGNPPCALGEDTRLLMTAVDDPGWPPVLLRARLVRLRETGEGTEIGFQFIEPTEADRRLIVALVYRAQREELRKGAGA